jgi:hypothetical protein
MYQGHADMCVLGTNTGYGLEKRVKYNRYMNACILNTDESSDITYKFRGLTSAAKKSIMIAAEYLLDYEYSEYKSLDCVKYVQKLNNTYTDKELEFVFTDEFRLKITTLALLFKYFDNK